MVGGSPVSAANSGARSAQYSRSFISPAWKARQSASCSGSNGPVQANVPGARPRSRSPTCRSSNGVRRTGPPKSKMRAVN